MKPERRSLYRILHVQPEAPVEIITAAYRCLMSKLRHHPDLGGDHDTAVRINEAYAVLSDEAKRRTYDRARRSRRAPRVAPREATRGEDEAAPAPRCCPFCSRAIPRFIGADTCCSDCGSPLAPIAHNLGGQRELFGRRSTARVGRNQAATIQLDPAGRPSAARLRDLSLTGISLYTETAVPIGTIVRITAPGADLVAHVVQARLRDRLMLVHARLLTARFSAGPGVFVSARA